MEANYREACDRDCLEGVFKHLTLRELARGGSVCRTWRTASCDDRLWRPHFEPSWSPEHCVNPTSPLPHCSNGAGRDCQSPLCNRLRHLKGVAGQPCMCKRAGILRREAKMRNPTFVRLELMDTVQ